MGRFEESLQAAQQAVALDSLAPLFHNAVALALQGLGRFAEAHARFQKAIELGPAMPVIYVNIGNVEGWAWGRIDKAVPWGQKALELDPEDDFSPVFLSGCHLHQAGMEGWRADWWYHLDHDPSFDSIRDAAEFKAVRTDIERDMAAQRARLDGKRKHSL